MAKIQEICPGQRIFRDNESGFGVKKFRIQGISSGTEGDPVERNPGQRGNRSLRLGPFSANFHLGPYRQTFYEYCTVQEAKFLESMIGQYLDFFKVLKSLSFLAPEFFFRNALTEAGSLM